ncbi:MAG: hypothetical protein ABUT20_37130 [Bacteroidota bacterium]
MAFNYFKDPYAIKAMIFIVCVLIVSTAFYPEYWYIDAAVLVGYILIFWIFRNWK